MSSRFHYLSGFESFRVGPGMPMDPVLARPQRRCKCGAVLSRYNASDTCCACMGAFDISAMAEALVGDRRIVDLGPLAKSIMGGR